MPDTFTSLGVPEDLVAVLAERGITTPFAVQAAAIPDGLDGRDVCGRAPTGSGKTLAFGLPMVARVGEAEPRRPRGLVLAPTRELAEQIAQELAPLAAARGREVVAIYGGISSVAQIDALVAGVDIVVGCPGRLADLIGLGELSLAAVDHVVVDEADRMADMGFLPEVRRLLDQTAPERQTTLFSATLDGDVAVLTERYQRDPVRHEVGPTEPDIHAMAHHFWRLAPTERIECAAELIMAVGPTVVFSRTRHGADRIARQLGKAGVDAVAIHGARSQRQRDRALETFAAGEAHALVATDVAARGIHVDGVSCVLHFDPPEDDKTYLHRSGRTARAGQTGVVVSFVAPEQVRHVARMQRQLGLPQEVSAPTPRAITPPTGAATGPGTGATRPPLGDGERGEDRDGADATGRGRRPGDPHQLRDRGPGQPAERRRRRGGGTRGGVTGGGGTGGDAPSSGRAGTGSERADGGPGNGGGGAGNGGRRGGGRRGQPTGRPPAGGRGRPGRSGRGRRG